MKITLRTAMNISSKIKEIGRDPYSNESLGKRRKLAEYVKKLTDDEWMQLKQQFERPMAY